MSQNPGHVGDVGELRDPKSVIHQENYEDANRLPAGAGAVAENYLEPLGCEIEC